MPILVDVLLEDQRWQGAQLGELADLACGATLKFLAMDDADYEISLLGCSDSRIAALNADFRGKPSPTNVLSWPSQDLAPARAGDIPKPHEPSPGSSQMLGDIAIAFETCAKEAKLAEKSQDQHVCHLLVHATLHLLGYDHIVDADAEVMQSSERQILATLGHSDPYMTN